MRPETQSFAVGGCDVSLQPILGREGEVRGTRLRVALCWERGS
jgi:hypothetical protein